MLLQEYKDNKLRSYNFTLNKEKINQSSIKDMYKQIYQSNINSLFLDITSHSTGLINIINSSNGSIINEHGYNINYLPSDQSGCNNEREKEQLAILDNYFNGDYYNIAPKIIYYDGEYGKYYLRTIIVPEPNYEYNKERKLYTVKNVINLPENMFKIHAYANGNIDFICENDIFLDDNQLPFFDLSLNGELTKKKLDKYQKILKKYKAN